MYEIESLLNPIDEERPAGRDLRLDPADLTFQTLKDLTAEVDASVAESEDQVREPNWSGVVGLCVSALSEKSKDLELVTALCEATVRIEGIPAIATGLQLLQRSLEGFWDRINPGYDEEDGEIVLPLRARWLNWMDSPKGYLQAVKMAPIVTAADGRTYTWQDRENSELLEDATTSPERRQELMDAGVIGEAQWESAIGGLAPETLAENLASLEDGIAACRAMAELCAERFGDEEPPDFFNLVNFLDELRDYFAGRVPDAAGAGEASGAAAAGEATTASGGVARGPVNNRQEALRQLQEVGDYFRRTEPHSPISYLIARAVKWGSMPLEQLLKDVVRSDDVIEHIWETLGLDDRAESEGEGEE